jgi:hypothetical protein
MPLSSLTIGLTKWYRNHKALSDVTPQTVEKAYWGMHWSDQKCDMAEWHDQIGLTSEFTGASALTALPMRGSPSHRLAAEPIPYQKP